MYTGGTRKKDIQTDRIKEQQETAKVYADFVKTFQSEGSPDAPTFVSGGVYDPSVSSSGPVASETKGQVYKPKKSIWLPPPSESLQSKKETIAETAKWAIGGANKDISKAREIDTFLEEIKSKQDLNEQRRSLRLAAESSESSSEEREYARRALDMLELQTKGKGSIPGVVEVEETTNLYIGNLSTEVTEDQLHQLFGKFGSITSVKIMYPRNDEEKFRGRHCGFVSFASRQSAEAAKNEFDNSEIGGMTVRIGWGKAMVKPDAMPEVRRDVVVSPPADNKKRTLIDLVAKYVTEDGHPFEQQLMERETSDPRFDFLFQHDSLDNIYYRWRVFANANGDIGNTWRTEPFQIYVGGPDWIPPKPPDGTTGKDVPRGEVAGTSTQAAKKSQSRAHLSGGQMLSQEDREEWEDMLRHLTKDRECVCEAMLFAMENSDAALEIADCLVEALTIPETPLDVKIARLYLLSDILHNSSSSRPTAWVFRAAFESLLPVVFEHLHAVYRGIEGRLTAEQLKETIIKLIRIWEGWAVYGPQLTQGLQFIFLQEPNTVEQILGDAIPPLEPETFDPVCDGEPLEGSAYLTMRQYPYWLRRKVLELHRSDLSQLERAGKQRGLLTPESKTKDEIFNQLIAFDYFWMKKREDDEKRLLALMNPEPPTPSISEDILQLQDEAAPPLPTTTCYPPVPTVMTPALPIFGEPPPEPSPSGLPPSPQEPPELEIPPIPSDDSESDDSPKSPLLSDDEEDIFQNAVPDSKPIDKAVEALRRAKLRDIEKLVAAYQGELERRGERNADIVQMQCDAKRSELIGQMEAAIS